MGSGQQSKWYLKDGQVSANGTYVLKGNTYGEARVRVSYKDNPNLYDDLIIKSDQ